MLIASLFSFAMVSVVGFYYFAENETASLRQRHYEDNANIARIVRDQLIEVYRGIGESNQFISDLAQDLSGLDEVKYIEVYDQDGGLSTMSRMDESGRPVDYALHKLYALKAIQTGNPIAMEHIPEDIYEVVAPLYMAGHEYGGKPIGAVAVGMAFGTGDREVKARANTLAGIVQLVVGKSASHQNLESLYVDNVIRRLGSIKGVASLAVYDSNMNLLSHSTDDIAGDFADAFVVSALTQVMESGRELSVNDRKSGRLVSYLPVPIEDGEGQAPVEMVIEMVGDVKYIENMVAEVRVKLLYVATAIIAATMLAIWLVLRAAVIRPVRQMSMLTEAVALGDLDARVEVSSEDELGSLAASFNRMTQQLSASRDELISARNFNDDVLASLYEALLVVSADGRVMMANNAAGELLHYETSELDNARVGAFMAGWEDVLSEVNSRGLALYSERMLIRKDGDEVPVSLSATAMSGEAPAMPSGIVIVATDISERKRVEEALRDYTRKLEDYTAELVDADQKMRESEQRFRLAFETGPDPVTLTRFDDGRYVDVNNSFTDLTGYAKAEVIGRSSYTDYSLWANRAEAEVFISGLQEGGHRNLPMRLRVKDGGIRECLVSASVFELGGDPHLLTLMRDITELRTAQRERDSLTEELLEKNRELEQIVYVSSHDLRSPLVNIQGFSKEIMLDFQTVSGMIEALDIAEADRAGIMQILREDVPASIAYISSSIEKMDSQLKGLLRLSRLGRVEVNLGHINMDALVDRVLKNFEFRIRDEGVSVETDALPGCIGDEALVEQAVSNIIDNALKYTDKPGRCELIISGWLDGSLAVYCFRDNGRGIRQEYQDRVFEIFHRLDPGGTGGEGLGLSIVQKAVSKSGGRVWVESQEGRGSRFYISLTAAGHYEVP